MALKTQRWTRADLERLPDDGNRYEVINGELLVSPAPSPAHEWIKREVRRVLEAYCDREGIAQVFDGNSAFVTDDSETIPDIVVRTPLHPPPERWDDAPVPMLVVEVLSQSTRRNDEVKKRRFYMETGVTEYWIVDRKARSVRAVTKAGERIATESLSWNAPGATAPLEIDLPALFTRALGPNA